MLLDHLRESLLGMREAFWGEGWGWGWGWGWAALRLGVGCAYAAALAKNTSALHYDVLYYTVTITSSERLLEALLGMGLARAGAGGLVIL